VLRQESVGARRAVLMRMLAGWNRSHLLDVGGSVFDRQVRVGIGRQFRLGMPGQLLSRFERNAGTRQPRDELVTESVEVVILPVIAEGMSAAARSIRIISAVLLSSPETGLVVKFVVSHANDRVNDFVTFLMVEYFHVV